MKNKESGIIIESGNRFESLQSAMERLRQRGGYTKGEAVPLPILSKKGVKTHNSLASIFLRDFNIITTTHNAHYVN